MNFLPYVKQACGFKYMPDITHVHVYTDVDVYVYRCKAYFNIYVTIYIDWQRL